MRQNSILAAFAAAVAALAFGACSEQTQDHYVLTGKCLNYQAGDILVLATQTPMGGLEPTDTLTVETDGSFRHEGTCEWPQIDYLVLMRNDDFAAATQFVLENADIDIEVSEELSEQPFARPAKAGPTQRAAEEFVFGLAELQEQAYQWVDAANNEELSEEEQAAAVASLDSLRTLIANHSLDFLMAHATEPVAQLFYVNVLSMFSPEQAKALTAAVRKSEKVNPMLEPLFDYVENYDAEMYDDAELAGSDFSGEGDKDIEPNVE